MSEENNTKKDKKIRGKINGDPIAEIQWKQS